MRCESILDAIGKTPLVHLSRLFRHAPFRVWAKCEFLNPGGSVKDRVAYAMILEAERLGKIAPGDTLIEPTSGNTGIGIALAGAVKGYQVIITMPEKMSKEKQLVLEALGAKIIRTPTDAPWDSPKSHISVANQLLREIPRSFLLNQYENPANPEIHIRATAEEILSDLGKCPDYVVVGAGTGGTITGLAKAFRRVNPDVKIIGVDPFGSILGGGTEVRTYLVEGIGYDFIPKVLERDLISQWVKTQDQTSFSWARRAIREEGLLCGGSSGAALSAIETIAGDVPSQSDVVVILADGVRNYMTKFMDTNWLESNSLSP